LTFPLKEKGRWDGNVFNILDERLYQAVQVNKPFSLGNNDFVQSVTVIQSDNDDEIIMTDLRKEVYAKDIGLVFKEMKILKYCVQPECFGNKVVDSGMEYTLSLIAYGKN
jgi:hypothetical protein